VTGENATAQITYYQYTAALSALFLAESRTLPQDAATAAAQIAAIVARNPSREKWPGAYVARIRPGDGSEPWTLTEDDAAVAEARRVLEGFGRNRPYSASELAVARQAVLDARLVPLC
jgi:hypothetical protein